MYIATAFRLLTGRLLEAMRSTDCTAPFISRRSAVVDAFRSSHCFIVPISSCSHSCPRLYRFPVVVFFDLEHRCLRNFNSMATIPVDVIRVKSYADSVLVPTCVPVRISINKLELGLVCLFTNSGGLGTGESYIPVAFFNPLICKGVYDTIGLSGVFALWILGKP